MITRLRVLVAGVVAVVIFNTVSHLQPAL
eukprot:COSAG06_NODE_64696_length_259_cov_0.462500_1_plen_28_part_10